MSGWGADRKTPVGVFFLAAVSCVVASCHAGQLAAADSGSAVDAAGASADSGAPAVEVLAVSVDGGFAGDFSERARTVMAGSAPVWTCAIPLPNLPVANEDEALQAVRQVIAGVVGVAGDAIAVTVNDCATPTTLSCARVFEHNVAKSGGYLSEALLPLAEELEASATSVEETIWVPTQGDQTLSGDVAISGISDGLLVGMIVFNEFNNCVAR